MIINYLTDTSFEIISTWEAVEEKKPKVKRKRKSTSKPPKMSVPTEPRKMTMDEFYNLLVATKYTLKDGKVIYRPRNKKTVEKMYKSIEYGNERAGFTEEEALERNVMIVDTDDNVLSEVH